MPPKKDKKKSDSADKGLTREPKRVWEKLSPDQRTEVMAFADDYLDFLNRGITERHAVRALIQMATQKDFHDLGDRATRHRRVFFSMRGKMLFLAVLGKRPVTDGIRLICSHVDCPRLDLKPNPLYEDSGLALLKTHYYGGVKKFHWVARPLAITGIVVRSDGSAVDVEIGRDPQDPVLTIPDLLPHLASKQMEKKASEFIPAENLNLLVGAIPDSDRESEEKVKLAILKLLNDKYGLTEEDFTTAELQVVPADPARSAGLDGSLVAGYGQDDRVCAYASARAITGQADRELTSVVVLYDKEEIGSEGNTSAKSRTLDMFLMELMERDGIDPSPINLHRLYYNSKALSADVAAGFDPSYPDVYEKRNSPKIGHGINLKKYTGHGGKYMASDANAEYAAWVRKLFNDNGIIWQAGAMGKVDEGGGGTVSKFLASTGMEIIDCGPAMLGMHSPFEVTSKDDVWMCYKAFRVFLSQNE